jgi:hypothetical protein
VEALLEPLFRAFHYFYDHRLIEGGRAMVACMNPATDRTRHRHWVGAVLTILLANTCGGVQAYRPPRIRRSALIPIGRPHDSAVFLPPEEWIFVAEVPAIVTQDKFDLVAEKLSHNRSFASRNNKTNTYLLRAMVSCGKCKLSCMALTKKDKYVHKYYVCAGKNK